MIKILLRKIITYKIVTFEAKVIIQLIVVIFVIQSFSARTSQNYYASQNKSNNISVIGAPHALMFARKSSQKLQ